MATLSIGNKARRVLSFLLGLRDARIAGTLRAAGFGQEDLDEAWRLLRDAVGATLPSPPAPSAPSVSARVRQLDAWENLWFPIAGATLRRRFPAIHERVFRNIGQAADETVVPTVTTFCDRIDALGASQDGATDPQAVAARALLATRGLTDEQIAAARSLLSDLATLEPPEPPPVNKEHREEAEAALWAWFIEWSQIARTVVRNRADLRALGYRRAGGKPASDADAAPDDDVDPPLIPPKGA